MSVVVTETHSSLAAPPGDQQYCRYSEDNLQHEKRWIWENTNSFSVSVCVKLPNKLLLLLLLTIQNNRLYCPHFVLSNGMILFPFHCTFSALAHLYVLYGGCSCMFTNVTPWFLSFLSVIFKLLEYSWP